MAKQTLEFSIEEVIRRIVKAENLTPGNKARVMLMGIYEESRKRDLTLKPIQLRGLLKLANQYRHPIIGLSFISACFSREYSSAKGLLKLAEEGKDYRAGKREVPVAEFKQKIEDYLFGETTSHGTQPAPFSGHYAADTTYQGDYFHD